MADVEPVAVQQSERPERNNEPIVFDESLLIYVKGKVIQPKQPDHAESKLLRQKLQAEISKRGDRIKEIKGIEEQLRSNAKGASSGNKEVIGKLKELRDQRGTVLRQKAAIRDELNNCDGHRDAIRAEMRSIRDKNRNVNPEKIEQDVRELEFKLTHESLAEQEEKRVQAQLQQLTAARPAAKKYAEYASRLQEFDAQRASVVARLKDSDGVIAQLDVQITAASSVLDEAKAKADAHTADLPTLQVEKQENYEIMVTLRAKIDEIRAKENEEYNEYIKRDRAYRGWKRAQERKKYEERQKAREERERQQQDETRAVVGDVVIEPYSGEIFTCDQLLTYLRSFTAVKEEVKEEVKSVEVPAGLKPFKRQEVVDEMFTGVPKRTPQSKAKNAAPAPKPVETPKPKIQKLNHTLDMLKVFLQLQVEPPTTTGAIPATIESVEARKAEYKVKQEEAKRAPPPSAPVANGNHKSAGKEVVVDDAEEASPAPAEEAAETATEEEAAAAEESPETSPEEETASEAAPPAEAAAAEPSSSEAAEEPAVAQAEEEPAAAPAAEEEAAEEEPAAPAAADEEEAPSSAGPADDGLDVKFVVEEGKVLVSVRAS